MKKIVKVVGAIIENEQDEILWELRPPENVHAEYIGAIWRIT